jgi:hypothetical protein
MVAFAQIRCRLSQMYWGPVQQLTKRVCEAGKPFIGEHLLGEDGPRRSRGRALRSPMCAGRRGRASCTAVTRTRHQLVRAPFVSRPSVNQYRTLAKDNVSS